MEIRFLLLDSYELWVDPQAKTARVMVRVLGKNWSVKRKHFGAIELSLDEWATLGQLYRERRNDIARYRIAEDCLWRSLSRKPARKPV